MSRPDRAVTTAAEDVAAALHETYGDKFPNARQVDWLSDAEYFLSSLGVLTPLAPEVPPATVNAICEGRAHGRVVEAEGRVADLRATVADIASRIEGLENRGYGTVDIGVAASWRGTLGAVLAATTPGPVDPEVPPRPELPPDFPIFGVGNTRIPGVDRHDRCSIHGEIGQHTSIAAHIQAFHGMTHEQYSTLAELYGVEDRDLYDEEDAAATRTPEPPDSGPECGVEVNLTETAYGNLYEPCRKPKGHVGSHSPVAEPPDSGDGPRDRLDRTIEKAFRWKDAGFYSAGEWPAVAATLFVLDSESMTEEERAKARAMGLRMAVRLATVEPKAGVAACCGHGTTAHRLEGGCAVRGCHCPRLRWEALRSGSPAPEGGE